jgi:hypothetical protein
LLGLNGTSSALCDGEAHAMIKDAAHQNAMTKEAVAVTRPTPCLINRGPTSRIAATTAPGIKRLVDR